MQAQAPIPKSRRRTFPEAVARLAQLQAFATARGIALPVPAHPINTHTKAKDLIADYERLLAGTSPVPVMPANAQPAAALIDAETLFKRAHAIIAKNKQNARPISSRPAASPANQRVDPRDLTASELEKAISSEKYHERRWLLFQELNARGRKVPTRQIIEKTRLMTIREIEQAIESEKDPEQRQMLFWQHMRRTAGNAGNLLK